VERVTYMVRGDPLATPTPSPTPSQTEYKCEFELLEEDPRIFYSAFTTMKNGKVFISGGRTEQFGSPSNASYIFDPNTHEFTRIENSHYKGHGSAVLLTDGRVLIYGGEYPEVYSFESNSFSPKTTEFECYQAPFVFPDNDVLLACWGDTYDTDYLAQVYNPDQDTISSFEAVEFGWRYGPLPPALSVPYTNASALVTDSYQIAIFNKESSTVEKNFSEGGHPYASIALSANKEKVYEVGGHHEDDEYAYEDAFVVDLTKFEKKRISNLLIPRAYHSVVGLLDGNMIAIGGLGGQDLVEIDSSIELYDTQENQWFDAGQLNIARFSPDAILLENGEILVIGGVANIYGTAFVPPPEIGTCKRVN
jgi:hypothetical protein